MSWLRDKDVFTHKSQEICVLTSFDTNKDTLIILFCILTISYYFNKLIQLCSNFTDF